MTDKPKVVFATCSLAGPSKPFRESLEAALPAVEALGYEHFLAEERGPYISGNRAITLRKALDVKPDVVIFLDYDMGFGRFDLAKLLAASGEVVAGIYRFKTDTEEKYMGSLFTTDDGRPVTRGDGAMRGFCVPAGFLKVTKEGIDRFMKSYPDLVYGPYFYPYVDLFNHGAHKRIWYGEDYAFSRNWRDCGGDIWILPNLDLVHWSVDHEGNGLKEYPSNFHDYMLRQPGGSGSANPEPPVKANGANPPSIIHDARGLYI